MLRSITTETSLGSLLIKPEAYSMRANVIEGLQEIRKSAQPTDAPTIERLIETFNIIADEAIPSETTHGVYAEDGEISSAFFDAVYPPESLGNFLHNMKNKWIGGQYFLVVFELPTGVTDKDAYSTLQTIKGKMDPIHPEQALGLRGYLMRSFLGQLAIKSPELINDEDYIHNFGNFIHIPDNSSETRRIFDYTLQKERTDKVEVIYSNIAHNR